VIRFALVATLRIAITAFFVLTAAYGIVSYSPFAFDMFIRPQLLTWVSQFVAWHHVWYLGAYAAAVVTLLPDLTRHAAADRRTQIARWLAIGFVIVFGLIAVRLVITPYLPSLWNDRRSLMAALVAFVPVLWLAAIDHLTTRPSIDGDVRAGRAPADHRLFVTCAAVAAYLWSIHVARALWVGGRGGTALSWVVTSLWTATLTATVWLMVLIVLWLIEAIAERTSSPRKTEYAILVLVLAAGLTELLRRLVLPTLAVDSSASAAVALAASVSVAATWSGLAMRRAAALPARVGPPLDQLFAPTSRRSAALVALALLPLVSFAVIRSLERLDWNFVLQRLVVVGEWTLAFGLVLGVTGRVRPRRWSPGAMLLLTAATLGMVWMVPRAALALARSTGDHRLEPTLALDRDAAAELSFKLLSSVVVKWPGFDPDYYALLESNVSSTAAITIPEVAFSSRLSTANGRIPDVYLFVVDSLRRDYLSPYNPAVTFTPAIADFARESFVFRNAFTRHGGTELGMPSIWVGGSVVRRILRPGFERADALERLLNVDGYRVAINDYTVAPLLTAATPVTKIDPDVPSAQTDLCHHLTSLREYIRATASDERPLFGYFAPMNVHLMNTRRGGRASPSDRDYPGFYSPYASRLKRIDGCFGEFIAFLKQTNRYDNSIIAITGDHGDSLGEDGNWGHAFWLFPEDVRLPLIMHIPSVLKAGLTTDLSRIAFSADITPTLYALLGHAVRDLGPLFGAPLFVPSDETLSPRRRESFLLTSSYAATYGLLRRNGRFLYVSDLFERKEFAFDLGSEPIGTPMVVDHQLQQVNHRLIRERVLALARTYNVRDVRH